MTKNNLYRMAMLPVLIFLFNSCLGLSLDIQMNRNGSGRVTMEYRISNLLNSIGALDGNESSAVIPVSRDDWERSIENIPGVKLVSFSKRVNALDNTVNAVFDYPDPQSLALLLDSTGKSVSISQTGQSGVLNMILYDEPSSNYDENLLALMRSFFNEYNITINFSAQTNSTLTVTNGKGNAGNIPSFVTAAQSGRRVSLSVGTIDLLEIPDGLGVKIVW